MTQTMDPRQITLELLAEVADVDPASLRPETELVADLGIDSPKALLLLVKIEDRFDIEIDDETVAEMKTVGEVLEAVERYESAAG